MDGSSPDHAVVLDPTAGTGPDPVAAPDPSFASWGRRVLAVWLDQALLAAAVYLAFPVQPVAPPPHYVPWGAPSDDPVAASWSASGWVWALLLVLFVTQAYLGSTPGKLVVGIAVVRESDGRPIGALRTAGRLVAHVLDSILLIGYLRPLWNVRRQTFADSLCGTVVLQTRRPLGTTPAWRTRLTAAAVAVCVPAVLFGLTSSGQGATVREEGCVVTGADPTPPPGTLAGGSVTTLDAPGVERRLGVERVRLSPDDGIRVGWDPTSVPAGDVVLRVTFTRADGTGARVVDHVLTDGVVQPGAGEPAEDGSIGVVLPAGTVDGLGDGWTWTLSTVVDGRRLADCVPFT